MTLFPLFKVHVPVEEALDQLRKVLESGFINEGVQVTQFTDAMRQKLEAPHLLLVNSCTSALTLALKLAGVGIDDDVVTTPMTCVATNTPIATAGARIVWADVGAYDGVISVESVRQKIGPRTRAVMAVAWAGSPPDLQGLRDLCDEMDVMLILDAAHAFGARYRGRPVHELADYTCYSFQAIKHVTTGDGGALVCRDADDFGRAKNLKWFGLDRDRAKDAKGDWKGQQWDADIIEAGYKFNMNNVAAAIGLAQLHHIDGILTAHRSNAAVYDVLLTACETVRPLDRVEGSESSSWVYTVRLTDRATVTRDEVLKRLNAEGIMAGVVHVPNDMYTAFADSNADLPGVREFSSRQFSLPCGWWIASEDAAYIAARVWAITGGKE